MDFGVSVSSGMQRLPALYFVAWNQETMEIRNIPINLGQSRCYSGTKLLVCRKLSTVQRLGSRKFKSLLKERLGLHYQIYRARALDFRGIEFRGFWLKLKLQQYGDSQQQSKETQSCNEKSL